MIIYVKGFLNSAFSVVGFLTIELKGEKGIPVTKLNNPSFPDLERWLGLKLSKWLVAVLGKIILYLSLPLFFD